MTTTQVQYWNYKEGQRHNVVTEKETNRHNKVTENLTVKDLQIKTYNAKEQKRHNIATENLTARDIDEKIRHNKTSEELTANQIDEMIRHNMAQEQEASRHNQAQEALTDYANKSKDTYYKGTVSNSANANEIRKREVDIEAMFKSAKSVTEFANMLDNVGLSLGAKIYAIEELLVNPNISKDSKQQLMKLVSKLYNSDVGTYKKSITDSKGNKKTVTTQHPNVAKKFSHR